MAEGGDRGGSNPFVRTPGQYVTKVETGGTESTLVVTQARIMTTGLFAIEATALIVFLPLIVSLGLIVIPIALVFAIFVGCTAWALWINRGEIGLPLLVFVALTIPTFFGVPRLIDSLVAGHFWEFLAFIVSATLAYFSPSIIVPAAFLSWRMAAEISDASYPAPKVSVKRGKPVWPWTSEGELTEEGFEGDTESVPSEREEMIALLQQAIAANQTPTVVERIVIPDRKRGEALNRQVEQDKRSSGVIYRQLVNNAWVAWIDDSQPVKVEDLFNYVDVAATSSGSYSTWRARGLGDNQHETIRRILERMEIIVEPGDRRGVHWLIEPGEASRLVRHCLDGNGEEHPCNPT